jgi:hypothetical protein
MNSTDQRQQNGLQIDLRNTEAIKCKCGNETFDQVYFLRSLPAIISPTLRAEIIPVPSFLCRKCKRLLEFDQKKSLNSQ